MQRGSKDGNCIPQPSQGIVASANRQDRYNMNAAMKAGRDWLTKFGNWHKRDLVFCERLERFLTPRVARPIEQLIGRAFRLCSSVTPRFAVQIDAGTAYH